MSGARIPCINPRCRRTAPAEKYEAGAEIICGKCFRALPEHLRNSHRAIWRDLRKWERRITRTVDEMKRHRMQNIANRLAFNLDRNWQEIRQAVTTPEKPEGLDNFLREVGL